MTQDEQIWRLDARLRADTLPVFEDLDRAVLLMNDRRWLWLIIVPKMLELEELHELPEQRLKEEMAFVGDLSGLLKTFSRCEKINVAAIGNIVRQLHIHVIARTDADANWPGPVWGYGKSIPYDVSEGDSLASQLKEQILAQQFS